MPARDAYRRAAADLRGEGDWTAFRHALVVAGFPERQAGILARQARAGAAVLARAKLSPAEARAALGLTAEQARNFLRMRDYLAAAAVSPERAAAMLRERARELAGAHLTLRPKSPEIAAGRRDFLAIDSIADRAAPRIRSALQAMQRQPAAGAARLRQLMQTAMDIAGRSAADSLGRRLGLPSPYVTLPEAETWTATRADELRGWLADAVAKEGGPLAAARIEHAAATQAYAAAQEGQRQAWTQAKDSGLLRSASRVWVTRGDGGVCYRCDPMDGQRRGIDEPFNSLGEPGSAYMNPGDPHKGWSTECRCAVLIEALVA